MSENLNNNENNVTQNGNNGENENTTNNQNNVNTNESNVNQNNQENTKFFSQEDLNKIITDRLKKERKKIESEFTDKANREKMTEIDRLKLENSELIKKIDKYNSDTMELNLKMNVHSIASKLNVVDNELIYLLINKENVKFENGKFIGIEEQIKELLAKKPYLVNTNQQAPNIGDNQNNSNSTTKKTNMNNLIRRAAGINL